MREWGGRGAGRRDPGVLASEEGGGAWGSEDPRSIISKFQGGRRRSGGKRRGRDPRRGLAGHEENTFLLQQKGGVESL